MKFTNKEYYDLVSIAEMEGACYNVVGLLRKISNLSELSTRSQARYAYWFIRTITKEPTPELEPYIAKDGFYSLEYAKFFVKGKFPLGEKEIYSDVGYSIGYDNMLKRNRKIDEPVVSLVHSDPDPTFFTKFKNFFRRRK